MRVAICEDSKLQYEVLKKQVLKWADEREKTIDIEGFESGEEFLFKWPEDCDFERNVRSTISKRNKKAR